MLLPVHIRRFAEKCCLFPGGEGRSRLVRGREAVYNTRVTAREDCQPGSGNGFAAPVYQSGRAHCPRWGILCGKNPT